MNTQANQPSPRRNLRATIFGVCSAAGLLAASPGHAQNLLVNGSFEQNPIPAGQTSQFGVAGWSGMNSQDAIRVLASSSWGELPAPLPDGVQALTAFVGGVQIGQVFTLTESTSLSFSIWNTLIPNSRGGANPLLSSFVSISDGTMGKGFDITASPNPGWQRHDWNVGTLAPGTYALTVFLSGDLAYDNASLVVVPEPGTVTLLGLGAVLFSLRWLRRRSAS
jgi:hypothetical protein